MKNTVNALYSLQKRRFFRYLVAAGTATLVDTVIYFFMVKVMNGAHLPSLTVSYSVGVITNFLITKYYVFHESMVRTSTQFIRFVLVAIAVFVANYFLMQILFGLSALLGLQNFSFEALVVRFVSAAMVAVLSFISHKVFSFEVNNTAKTN